LDEYFQSESPVAFFKLLEKAELLKNHFYVLFSKAKDLNTNEEDGMDAHFFFGLALVGFIFFLCYWFRNEKKDE